MARGWESKAIESQMEDRGSRDAPRPPMSAEARERAQKRAALELSRARVIGELAACRSEVRRASLEGALAFLDDALRGLEGEKT